MGYESKIIVAEVKRYSSTLVFAEKIAEMCMACMSDDFPRLFTKEIDYKIIIDGDDNEVDTDLYGKKLTTAPIDNVIAWLEGEVQKYEYRRLRPLLGLLKGFDPQQWNELQIIHFGY